MAEIRAIADILDIAANCLSACYKYINGARNAPAEIIRAAKEVEQLPKLLETLHSVATMEANNEGQTALGGPAGLFATCTAILQDLTQRLKRIGAPSSLRARLMWVQEKKKFVELLKELERAKSFIILIIEAKNVKEIASINRHLEDNKRENIFKWLQQQSPDHKRSYEDAKRLRSPDTGNWFLESELFVSWLDYPNSYRKNLLWLNGIPGAGKTVLAAAVIEKLEGILKDDKISLLAYFFFDFRDDSKRTALGCMCSILLQIALTSYHAEIEALYDRNTGCMLTLHEVIDALTKVLNSTKKPVLVIDSLDECLQDNERNSLFKALRQIHHGCNECKILVTSRLEPDITRYLKSEDAEEVEVAGERVQGDIQLFITSELEVDRSLSKWSKQIKEEITDEVCKRAQGMFRLAGCQVAELKPCCTEQALRETIQSLPETLDKMYSRIFKKIPAQNVRETAAVLTLLTTAQMPLSVAEILEATGVDVENKKISPERQIQDSEALLKLCPSMLRLSGLSKVVESHLQNRGICRTARETDQFLELAHLSVKEYISTKLKHSYAHQIYSYHELECHLRMFKTCLTYLQSFHKGKVLHNFNFDKHMFLPYSATFWFSHWKALSPNLQQENESYLQVLFDHENLNTLTNVLNVWDPRIILRRTGFFLQFNKRIPAAITPPTALHVAAFQGLGERVRSILQNSAHEITGEDIANALGAAAVEGHMPVIELLLEKGGDPNGMTVFLCDMFNQVVLTTVLQASAFNGSMGCLKRLIEAGAKVDQTSSEYGSALHVAASRGNTKVVELLLNRGAKTDAFSHKFSGTPLLAAASSGHNETVQLLWDKGTYTEFDDELLLFAVDHCNAKTIEMLLDKGISPEKPSAIARAALRERLDIIQLLLKTGADINSGGGDPIRNVLRTTGNGDGGDRSLACFDFLVMNGADVHVPGVMATAIRYKKLSIIRRLLGFGVLPTATEVANMVNMWEDDLAKEILERFDVDINADVELEEGERFNGAGGSLLEIVIYQKRPDLVELLLSKGVNINQTTLSKAGSAIIMASREGSKGLVQQLLDHGATIDPITSGEYGSPLIAAAESGDLEVVSLLLARGSDINYPGRKSGSALQKAARMEHVHLVEMLLYHGADVNISGGTFVSPLRAAISSRNIEITTLILEAGADVNLLESKNHMYSAQHLLFGTFCCALEVAVATGNITLVRMLLDRGAVISPEISETVLQLASWCPEVEMLKLVVGSGASVERFGGIALLTSVQDYLKAKDNPSECSRSQEEKVMLLLKMGADVDMVVESGSSTNCLKEALVAQDKELVKCLLERGANVNMEINQIGSSTIFQAAFDWDHGEGIDLLLANRANLNLVCGSYGTALGAAIHSGNDLYQTLLSKGAQIDINCAQFPSPLEIALCCCNYEIAKDLIVRGADVYRVGAYTGPMLPAICAEQNAGGPVRNSSLSSPRLEIIRLMLSRGVPVDIDDKMRGSALQVAAYVGDENLVSFLLKHGADPNKAGGEFGYPLQAAAYKGAHEVITVLLSHGSDINAIGGRFGTALQAACTNGSFETASLLLENGADLNIEDGLFGTALQATAFHGPFQLLKELIDRGAKLNTSCGYYGSPLQAACKSRAVRRIKLLVNHGAEVNHPGGKHGFPLHAVVCNRSRDHKYDTTALKFLLDTGANINAVGELYGTALQAAAYHSVEDAKVLLAYGAEVNIAGGRFGSALRAARAMNSSNFAKLLLDSGAQENVGAEVNHEDAVRLSKFSTVGYCVENYKLEQFLWKPWFKPKKGKKAFI
jgi:ankyrin repeat protein